MIMEQAEEAAEKQDDNNRKVTQFSAECMYSFELQHTNKEHTPKDPYAHGETMLQLGTLVPLRCQSSTTRSQHLLHEEPNPLLDFNVRAERHLCSASGQVGADSMKRNPI